MKKIQPPVKPGAVCCLEILQNEECAGGRSQLEFTSGNLFTAQAGELVVFAQLEVTAIQGHDTAAQTVTAGQNVSGGCLGQFQSGGIFQRVVDYQIDAAVLAILAGVAVDMGAFLNGDFAVCHKSVFNIKNLFLCIFNRKPDVRIALVIVGMMFFTFLVVM